MTFRDKAGLTIFDAPYWDRDAELARTRDAFAASADSHFEASFASTDSFVDWGASREILPPVHATLERPKASAAELARGGPLVGATFAPSLHLE